MSSTKFYLDLDRNDVKYYTSDLAGLEYDNFSKYLELRNGAYFTERFLPVSLVATHSFSNDLTTRDDVLLAFLSMFLLLALEGVVATVLLGTKDGKASSVGFSIKCIFEVLRDFDWNLNQLRRVRMRSRRRRMKGNEKGNEKGVEKKGKKKPFLNVNSRLVLFAVLILLCIFGVEVLILHFTAPVLSPIYNNKVSLRIQNAIIPDWRALRWALRTAIDKPCESILLTGVHHGNTRITGCVLANVTGIAVATFDKLYMDRRIKITTDLHEYGAEHIVEGGKMVDGKFVPIHIGRYSTRGLLMLDDGRARLMRVIEGEPDEDRKVMGIHTQFLAYLFSIYSIQTRDKMHELTLDKLNAVKINFKPALGVQIKVLDVNGEDLAFRSKRFVSTMDGEMPAGSMLMHFAQHLFRSSATVRVESGDETDLFEKDGLQRVSAVVWWEETRVLNWLTLFLVLFFTLLFLSLMRMRLKPLSTVNIASEYVKRAVGANLDRSPMELDANEDEYFRVDYAGIRGVSLGTAPINGSLEYRYGSGMDRGSTFEVLEYSDGENGV